MIEFLKSMTDLLQITFRNGEAKTGMNNAMAYTMKNALTGTFPDIGIDYSLAKVSRGNLPFASAPRVAANGQQLTFSWTPNAGTGSAADTDKSVLVVYCPVKKQCLFTTDGPNRAAGTAVVDASAFIGNEVHTYLAFINEDEEESSDSVYTGILNL